MGALGHQIVPDCFKLYFAQITLAEVNYYYQSWNYESSSTKNITVEVNEQIIGFSPTKSNEPKPPEPEPLKLQSDIKYKKVKHDKIKYYVISGESPQTLYKILEDGECGEKCGKRIKKEKGYEYQLDP